MTTGLRKRFEGEMGRRFRKLKGMILQEISEQDGFGLRANAGKFQFTRTDQKVGAFMEWLQAAQAEQILGVSLGTPVHRAAQNAWTRVYIESAYQQGISMAGAELRSAGATVDNRWVSSAFNRPLHADRVGLAYTRAFTELQGVTAAMDQGISRELALGLAEGRNPLDIARKLNGRVDAIGRTRARMLARTEVISAHAEASLNAYEEAGIEGVDVEAEWSTAGDDKVCERCEAAAAAGPYELEKARGLIPLHPNCRCAFIPRVVNGTGIELR